MVRKKSNIDKGFWIVFILFLTLAVFVIVFLFYASHTSDAKPEILNSKILGDRPAQSTIKESIVVSATDIRKDIYDFTIRNFFDVDLRAWDTQVCKNNETCFLEREATGGSLAWALLLFAHPESLKNEKSNSNRKINADDIYSYLYKKVSQEIMDGEAGYYSLHPLYEIINTNNESESSLLFKQFVNLLNYSERELLQSEVDSNNRKVVSHKELKFSIMARQIALLSDYKLRQKKIEGVTLDEDFQNDLITSRAIPVLNKLLKELVVPEYRSSIPASVLIESKSCWLTWAQTANFKLERTIARTKLDQISKTEESLSESDLMDTFETIYSAVKSNKSMRKDVASILPCVHAIQDLLSLDDAEQILSGRNVNFEKMQELMFLLLHLVVSKSWDGPYSPCSKAGGIFSWGYFTAESDTPICSERKSLLENSWVSFLLSNSSSKDLEFSIKDFRR